MNEDTSKGCPTQANAVGAVIVFFILLFIFAKWGPSLPFSVLSQNKGEPMIVIGEGKATAAPDIAKVSFGVQDSGTTLAQVQDSVNKKSQSLVSALEKLGVDKKDIKTTSYNIYPESDYQANPPKIAGYRVSINYEVAIRKIDKVNDVLTTVTGAGANVVGQVSFDLSDDSKAKTINEARQNAVEKAKESAESLAKASGIVLGRIINVSESLGTSVRPYYLTEKAVSLDSAPAAANPDIQPGTTEVNLTVSLSYEIR